MSRIFVTGDTHGNAAGEMKRLSTKKFKAGKELTKDDYVIVLGDFGLLWQKKYSKTELHWLKFLEEKPWTTLFLDGNHENHTMLNSLKKIKKFGGTVGKVSDSIFHLKRGEIYQIGNKKIFTLGGAESTDKKYRIVDVSWWSEEVPSHSEIDYALGNLEKHNNKVDYILAHTAPTDIIRIYFKGLGIGPEKLCPAAAALQHICQTVSFKDFYCGHFHDEWNFGKYHILYNEIIELEE